MGLLESLRAAMPDDTTRLERVVLTVNVVLAACLTAALVAQQVGQNDVVGASVSPDAAEPVPVIVVVAASSVTDEAIARPAARVLGGRLMVIPNSGLSSRMTASLSRARPRRIVVVGGPAAVSGATVEALRPYTFAPVTRLAGADRYETAAKVAESQRTPPVRHLQVMSGEAVDAHAPTRRDGADAPLLLVERDRVPAATASALQRLQPDRIDVLGTTSEVTDAVVDQLRALTTGAVSRVP